MRLKSTYERFKEKKKFQKKNHRVEKSKIEKSNGIERIIEYAEKHPTI